MFLSLDIHLIPGQHTTFLGQKMGGKEIDRLKDYPLLVDQPNLIIRPSHSTLNQFEKRLPNSFAQPNQVKFFASDSFAPSAQSDAI